MLEGDSEGEGLSESLETPSVASPNPLYKLVSREEEDEKNSERIGEDAYRVIRISHVVINLLTRSKRYNIHHFPHMLTWISTKRRRGVTRGVQNRLTGISVNRKSINRFLVQENSEL